MEPFATVVICTMEKPKARLMNELSRQTFRDFEIIVASEKGFVNAMNRALKKAQGEIFIRIDDDVEIPIYWLEELLAPFKWNGVAGVTGPTLVPKMLRQNRDSIRAAENPNWFLRWMFDGDPYVPARIYKCGSVSYGSNYKEHIDFTGGWFTPDHLEGTNWAMRTHLIRHVGGFDPKFDGVGEWFDTDVEQKIIKLGHHLVYSPPAFLTHVLTKGKHYSQRYAMGGRIKNWLRFHIRHSEFHYKKIIWLIMMMGYGVCQKFR